nr:hypothetical protein [Tanacetum cinerariifolium]GEX18317.1 hypothetical protein [Tanacetum cinerariifolium]
MTTPRPTPFRATTPRAEVLILFLIISDFGNEITTLPIRHAPSSSDCIPAFFGYPLDSGNDSLDKDLSKTVESLYTQTASTLDLHSPPTQPVPTSPAFSRRPGTEIPTSPPSLLPSSSSPPSLLQSSSSLLPSLLPSSSHKRPRSPSPPPLSLVSPSPLLLSPLPSPPAAIVPPPPGTKAY